MKKLNYQELVKRIIYKYGNEQPKEDLENTEIVFDTERVGLCPAVGIAIYYYMWDGMMKKECMDAPFILVSRIIKFGKFKANF